MKQQSLEKLARILRTDPETLAQMDEQMSRFSGKSGVLESVVLENRQRIHQTLEELSLSGNLTAEIVSQALLERLKQEDQDLRRLFGRPDFTKQASVQPIIEAAKKAADPPKGLFLKKDRAIQMIKKTPPPHLLKALGYGSVEALFQKEDFWQVFASLRFVESRQWMNEQFLPQYAELKPLDFERREVKVIFLDKKWIEIAEQFIQKKYHNLSHLKELGLVFVVPLPVEIPGMLTQVLVLMLHYLNEVPFYARLTEHYIKDPETFTDKFIAMLKGEVSPAGAFNWTDGALRWLIVQRYLAKDNPRDPRLFIPHVNPEAIHWAKAQRQLAGLSATYKSLQFDLWGLLSWVGDFFPSEKEGELLVSFDLVDNIMSLVKQETLIKYLYHHQEALWNKLFMEYTGPQAQLESWIVQNLDKGYITIEQ